MAARFAASCFGLLLTLLGCASPSVAPGPTPPQPPPIAQIEPEPGLSPEMRVGLLLPLSGPSQPLGEDMLQAAQMAVFDVGENKLVLLPQDTAGTPEGAAAAARAALAEGAELIIGPVYRASVPAVVDAVRGAGVPSPGQLPSLPVPGTLTPPPAGAGLLPPPPSEAAAAGIAPREPVKVLAFSNASDVAAPGVYLLGFRPEEQVERVVDFALSRGLRRIAALAPDDAYGRVAMEALRAAVVRGGGELGPTRFYPPGNAIPSDIVRDMAQVDQRLEGAAGESGAPVPERATGEAPLGRPLFDAILLPDGGNRLRSVASLLAYYGVDAGRVRYLGTWRWQAEDPEALQDAALQGSWIAAPSPSGINAFQRRFAAAFGHEPAPLAALAYDATALTAIVARDLGNRSFDDEALTAGQGFLGASGPFRLRPDGLAEHGLAVLQIGPNGALEVVSEPPASFAAGVAAR